MADSRGDFLAGLLVGGVVGLAVGVLFAPATGEETRGQVRVRTGEAVDRVRAGADQFGERVREGIGRAREGVSQLADEMRSRLPGSEAADGTGAEPATAAPPPGV